MARGIEMVKGISGPGWPADPEYMGCGELQGTQMENICGGKSISSQVLE